MAYLKLQKKVSKEEMRRFVGGKTLPAEAVRPTRSPEPAALRANFGGSEFRILDSLDSQPNPKIEHEVIAGAVGTGAATEFSAFLRMFRELPNVDAILLNPTQEPVPENAAAQYAVSSALARCASDTNFDRICVYLNRLPTEFRVLCVRDATLRQPAIRCTAGYTRWAIENHHAIA